MDEIVAAELILNAAGDSTRLSLNSVQGGIAAFHVRRQYILDLVRFVLDSNRHGDLLDAKFKSFVAKLTKNQTPTLLSRTLKGMKDIEDLLTKLQEKETRGSFLGQLESREFVETLKLRRDFILNEHDLLGQILYSLIECDHLNFHTDISNIFTHIQSLETYDSILMHYIPAIAQIGLRVDPTQSLNPFSLSLKEAIGVKDILSNEKVWKLQYWRGTVQLIYYTYVAGLHRFKSLDGETVGIDYKTDILDPVREAIDAGAFELLLFIASDINPCQTEFEPFIDFRPQLQFYVPPFKSLRTISDNLSDLIISCLEKYIEAVIANIADILREMRLNEEDMFLANTQADTYEVSEPIGMDLERFFIFISCLYYGRPDAACMFWADPESDLYGFIQWASQCDILAMVAAFSHMLASLATGPTCALAAHKFLCESTTSASFASRTRRIARLSWHHIFGNINESMFRLKPPQPPPSSLLLSKAKFIADIPELDQGEILMLTNFLSILSQIVTYSSEAREELLASEEFHIIPSFFEFLSFYTPLYGPILNVFSGFSLTTTPQYKEQIWFSLDLWLFNTTIAFPQNEYLGSDISPKERMARLLDTYPSVLGCAQLLESLLRSLGDHSDLYTLPYPENLGEKYRTPGIWPYVDYMINEVFYTATTTDTLEKGSQIALQGRALKFIRHCLELFDSEIAVLSASAGVNLDVIVRAPSFLSYLLAHPSAPAMSYLFNSKIYNPLVKMASAGIDVIAELPDSNPTVEMLIDSLRIINSIFDLQNTFIDVIVKVFRKSGDSSIPLSTHGLSSFEDAILYNIPVISHLALYVGSTNVDLARLALQLLDRISHSTQFSAPSFSTVDSRIKGNRLLSILETVDESTRIKEGFIEQLERPAEYYFDALTAEKSMQLKEEIIKLISYNLSKDTKDSTIAHFLLGFKVKSDGSLMLDRSRGGILSEISLLDSIMNILRYGLQQITFTDVPKLPTVISSGCSNIIQLLMQTPASSFLVLDYFREHDFFITLLNSEPTIDLNAFWEGRPFQDTPEFLFSDSSRTLEAFLKHRSAFLKCLSIEVHTAAVSGSLSLVSRFRNSLVNMDLKRMDSFGSSSATRILSFLDVLEFNLPTMSDNTVEIVKVFGEQVFTHFFKKDADIEFETSVAELKLLLRLKGLEFVASKSIDSLEDPEFVKGANYVVETFTKRRVYDRLRANQLECLNSWAKLVLVLVNDTDMSRDARTTFLLETFQSIIHKLVQYSISDVVFAESIASLLVSLFSIYQADMEAMVQSTENAGALTLHQKSSYDRTHSLFKAAISSISTPSSTPTLRSELYVISYRYLRWVLIDVNGSQQSASSIRSCIQIVRTSGDRLIEMICNDAISGEGNTRLTALVLLDVLCSLSSRAHSTFLLDSLIKYNLLLLVVQSITRYDKELVNREKSNSVKLYYEFMTFKSVLSFLLQVARTRQGAHQIIQCGLFTILKSFELLRIDPDVGIDIPILTEVSNAGTSVDAQPTSNGNAKNNNAGDVNVHQPTDTQSTFYGLVSPIFQLVTAVLLSMGSENEPVIARVRSFLQEHELLVVALLRKDVLTSEQQHPKLNVLVKHVVLLISLTDYIH